jgi:hypothetical protein
LRLKILRLVWSLEGTLPLTVVVYLVRREMMLIPAGHKIVRMHRAVQRRSPLVGTVKQAMLIVLMVVWLRERLRCVVMYLARRQELLVVVIKK